MEHVKKLAIRIHESIVLSALNGKKPDVIYIGSAEFSMIESLCEMGVACKIQGCIKIFGVRVIRTVESSHLEVY